MDRSLLINQVNELERELVSVCKKYNLLYYFFSGIVGEPGKGIFPVSASSVLKPQFAIHPYVIIHRQLHVNAVEDFRRRFSGDVLFHSIDDKVKKDFRTDGN